MYRKIVCADAMKGNRRSVLRTVGISATGLLAGSTVGSANPVNKYSGLAYDPETHDIIGEATGSFDNSGRKLTGELTINMDGGLEVINRSVNRQEPDHVEKGGGPARQVYTDYERRGEEHHDKKKVPIEKRRWVTSGRTISGVIRTRSREKIAFTFFPEKTSAQPDITLNIKRKEETEEDVIKTRSVSSSSDDGRPM